MPEKEKGLELPKKLKPLPPIATLQEEEEAKAWHKEEVKRPRDLFGIIKELEKERKPTKYLVERPQSYTF